MKDITCTKPSALAFQDRNKYFNCSSEHPKPERSLNFNPNDPQLHSHSLSEFQKGKTIQPAEPG
ncbi:MAG: hypothetical protein AAGG59_16470, partial [Bacteroidota bacterium]